MYYCHKRNVCTLCKNCIAFRHFKSYFLSEYSNNKVTIAVVVSVLSITSFRWRVGARVHEWGRVRTSYHGTGRPTLPLWSNHTVAVFFVRGGCSIQRTLRRHSLSFIVRTIKHQEDTNSKTYGVISTLHSPLLHMIRKTVLLFCRGEF